MPSNNPSICFDCRTSFKGTSICPHCNKPLKHMFKRFKSPRKDRTQAWKNLQALYSGTPSKFKHLKDGHNYGVNTKSHDYAEMIKKYNWKQEKQARFRKWGKAVRLECKKLKYDYRKIPRIELEYSINKFENGIPKNIAYFYSQYGDMWDINKNYPRYIKRRPKEFYKKREEILGEEIIYPKQIIKYMSHDAIKEFYNFDNPESQEFSWIKNTRLLKIAQSSI